MSLTAPVGSCSGGSTDLAAGQVAAFTATYTVTAADVTAGHVADAATATGTPAGGTPVTTPPSTVTIPSAGLTIVKTADRQSFAAAGDVVTYTFTVANTGAAPLTGVTVNDTQTAPAGALTSGPSCVSLTAPAGSCSGGSTDLAAGQVATFTGTYTVTAADVGAGRVADAAAATGTPPGGTPVTTPPSTVTIPSAGLTVVKTADRQSFTAAGDVVTYTFTVANTGGAPLTGVSVNDTQTAPAGVLTSGPTCVVLASPAGSCSGGSTDLAAGQAAAFTATYTVTTADVTAGHVADAATATGTPPGGTPVTTPPSTVTIPAADLTIVKTADRQSFAAAGDVVTYTFTVTNTGGAPLTGVSVNDTQTAPAGALTSGPACVSLTSPSGGCSGGSTDLAAGQVAAFTATYTVTAADVGAGHVADAATATGTPPGGTPVTTPPSTVSIPAAGLTVVKTADRQSFAAAGDVVAYTFTVTDTGGAPLTGVSVNDTQTAPAGALTSGPACVSLTAPVGACSGPVTDLAAGQVATFTATYTVTAADVTAGHVADAATATGTPPGGTPVTTPPSTVSIPSAVSRITENVGRRSPKM